MRKYLVDFNTAEMKKEYTDVLIIGSGIAGVYTALELGDKYKITFIIHHIYEEIYKKARFSYAE